MKRQARARVATQIAGEPQPCDWFAACDYDTIWEVEHPTLGPTRICPRCAAAVGVAIPPIKPLCEHEGCFDFSLGYFKMVIHDPDDGFNTSHVMRLCQAHHDEAHRDDFVLELRPA